MNNPEMYPSRRRERTLSLISMSSTRSTKIVLDVPKTSPTSGLTVQPGPSDAFGSFTTTGSASAFLRALAAANALWERSSHVRHRRQKSCPAPMWYDDVPRSNSPHAPTSPIFIHSETHAVPSISRTSSSFYQSDDHSSQNSVSDLRSSGGEGGRTKPSKINPILASLEKKSRLCSRTICVTCSKPGLDYPSCGRCGDVWCSRACRLKGGKRHVC